jgi:hypothetical protein
MPWDQEWSLFICHIPMENAGIFFLTLIPGW